MKQTSDDKDWSPTHEIDPTLQERLVSGKPVIDENGNFFLATPVGPSAPINLIELTMLFSNSQLMLLKKSVDEELWRRSIA